ncbi:MAG: hypothetical protein RR765_03550 [Peptostreptococcaceae bacterium]
MELTTKGIETAIRLEQNLYENINAMFYDMNQNDRDDINESLEILAKFCMNNKRFLDLLVIKIITKQTRLFQ